MVVGAGRDYPRTRSPGSAGKGLRGGRQEEKDGACMDESYQDLRKAVQDWFVGAGDEALALLRKHGAESVDIFAKQGKELPAMAIAVMGQGALSSAASALGQRREETLLQAAARALLCSSAFEEGVPSASDIELGFRRPRQALAKAFVGLHNASAVLQAREAAKKGDSLRTHPGFDWKCKCGSEKVAVWREAWVKVDAKPGGTCYDALAFNIAAECQDCEWGWSGYETLAEETNISCRKCHSEAVVDVGPRFCCTACGASEIMGMTAAVLLGLRRDAITGALILETDVGEVEVPPDALDEMTHKG